MNISILLKADKNESLIVDVRQQAGVYPVIRTVGTRVVRDIDGAGWAWLHLDVFLTIERKWCIVMTQSHYTH